MANKNESAELFKQKEKQTDIHFVFWILHEAGEIIE
jgi:hypothetical protein